MQGSVGILASYGTGPMGRLGRGGISKSSQSTISRSKVQEKGISEVNRESMEARARLHAYERYKDDAVRSDQQFQFFKRIVPLSSIHSRTGVKQKVSPAVLKRLRTMMDENGWSDTLGYITVCDDSIAPLHGPSSRIRSHLLMPTFSIVDGHLRVDALNLAKEKGLAVPDNLVVEVAVPAPDIFPADIEVHLLELAFKMNRNADKSRVPKPRVHRDLRRVIFMRRFLNAHPEFRSMSVECLGKGRVQKAAFQAFEQHAIPGDCVGSSHLERYVRVALLFKASPEAYSIYKRELQKRQDGTNHVSIVTLNSGTILRSEPSLQALLVECLFAYGNKHKSQIRKRCDTIFIRNVIRFFSELRNAAEQLGWDKASFLNTSLVIARGKKISEKCTLREAIVSLAPSRAMCSATGKVQKILTTLQDALRVSWRDKQRRELLSNSQTARLPLPSKDKPLFENATFSKKGNCKRNEEVDGEETMTMSLVHGDQTRNKGEDSLGVRSKQEEVELQKRILAFRELAVSVGIINRGQKRRSSPQPQSILRRKVLKRDVQRPLDQTMNGDIASKSSHLYIHGRSDDSEDADSKQRVSLSKQGSFSTRIPIRLYDGHQARVHLGQHDFENLRIELLDYSLLLSCAGEKAWQELYKEKATESVRSCAQFVSFWSNQRATVDEKGYSQIELPTTTLTAAVRKLLKSAKEICPKKNEELGERFRSEGRTFVGETYKVLHSTDVKKPEQSNSTFHRYDVNSPKVYRARVVVEATIAVMAEWLGLIHPSEGEGGTFYLSEATLLQTKEHSNSGKPRLAFGSRRSNSELWEPEMNPSYMFIVSGDTGFPMFVWERTHVLLQSPDELLPLIAKHVKPRRIAVKPRSVFLCRGDLVHAFENSSHELDLRTHQNPLAVTCHLLQSDIARKHLAEPVEAEEWWTKYIATPGS